MDGPSEVKNHPWLRDYPWNKLANKEIIPPFIPNRVNTPMGKSLASRLIFRTYLSFNKIQINMQLEEKEANQSVPIPIRWEIVHLKKSGLTGKEVSQQLSVSASTANRIYKKYLDTGEVKDLTRTGRPMEATEEEEKNFIKTVTSHPEMSVNQLIEESDSNFSRRTGSRILKDHGFSNKTAKTKWWISDENRQKRLAWAKEYEKFPVKFWKRVVFTDESKVQFNTKKQKLWLPQEITPEPIERNRWQVSILVWGAIRWDETSAFECINGTLNSSKYLDILKRKLLRNLPALRDSSPLDHDSNTLVFQQDNARIHTTSIVTSYFEERSIYVLPWPPQSPDLSIIEVVWARLKDGLKRSYDSREELQKDISFIWKNIPSDFIDKLYSSIPDRIKAVIEAQGGPTNY